MTKDKRGHLFCGTLCWTWHDQIYDLLFHINIQKTSHILLFSMDSTTMIFCGIRYTHTMHKTES